MKKLCALLLATCISTSTFASPDLCKDLTGTWNGTYHDPSQLFPAGNFPIALQLRYQKNKVYGYTLPANDSHAGRFGEQPGAYLFIATCQNNTLTNIYFIKNQTPICGDPSDKTIETALTKKDLITNLSLPYENAMINANLRADLTKQVEASTMDTSLLAQVIELANGTIKTCH